VALIGDKDVRSLYAHEIKARLDSLLGTQSFGQQSQQRGAGRAMSRGRKNSWGARRPTHASSELRRSDLGRGESDFPRREAVIVLAVLNHPKILLSHRDSFENLDLSSAELNRLKFNIIDYFDHLDIEADEHASGLDNVALTRHLNSLEQSKLVERLRQMPEAKLLTFVRQESAIEDATSGWLETTIIHHKLRTLIAEKAEVEKELEYQLMQGNQDALERMQAIQNEIAALEYSERSA
jgi:DNA primase